MKEKNESKTSILIAIAEITTSQKNMDDRLSRMSDDIKEIKSDVKAQNDKFALKTELKVVETNLVEKIDAKTNGSNRMWDIVITSGITATVVGLLSVVFK